VEIPANTVAEIMLPALSKKYHLTIDGAASKGILNNDFVRVEIGSGKHRLVINE
jgi:propanediol utilization protein